MEVTFNPNPTERTRKEPREELDKRNLGEETVVVKPLNLEKYAMKQIKTTGNKKVTLDYLDVGEFIG